MSWVPRGAFVLQTSVSTLSKVPLCQKGHASRSARSKLQACFHAHGGVWGGWSGSLRWYQHCCGRYTVHTDRVGSVTSSASFASAAGCPDAASLWQDNRQGISSKIRVQAVKVSNMLQVTDSQEVRSDMTDRTEVPIRRSAEVAVVCKGSTTEARQPHRSICLVCRCICLLGCGRLYGGRVQLVHRHLPGPGHDLRGVRLPHGARGNCHDQADHEHGSGRRSSRAAHDRPTGNVKKSVSVPVVD
jgi:hypothetical protein